MDLTVAAQIAQIAVAVGVIASAVIAYLAFRHQRRNKSQ
jgi:hypothetical protein